MYAFSTMCPYEICVHVCTFVAYMHTGNIQHQSQEFKVLLSACLECACTHTHTHYGIVQVTATSWCMYRLLLIPRMHEQGVKQSVCPSVVVVIIGTKIARSWDLDIWASCKHNQTVKCSENLAWFGFKSMTRARIATNIMLRRAFVYLVQMVKSLWLMLSIMNSNQYCT